MPCLCIFFFCFFFLNEPAPPEIPPLPHHDPLPFSEPPPAGKADYRPDPCSRTAIDLVRHIAGAEMRFLETTINAEFPTAAGLPETVKTPAERSEEHTSELQSHLNLVCRLLLEKKKNLQR